MSIESEETKNAAAVQNSVHPTEAAERGSHSAAVANTRIEPDSVTDEPNADDSRKTAYSDRIAGDDQGGDDRIQQVGDQRGTDDRTQQLGSQSGVGDSGRQLGVDAGGRQPSGQRGVGDRTQQPIEQSGLRELRDQWREVQTMFVDDPRDAVTRADGLISGTIQGLTDTYTQRRQALEKGWSGDNSADTEQLRQALRGYRDLFDQLMTASAGGATNM
ncbi:MAG: hypothetical protein JWN03_7163 [Nocardia sp.]|uniref:hypothetical protein n=1 Tax=Nocardia sp. TaxID=1821 RepID=UPI002607FDC9|nr:hypothetical protein [Nocardia sp.]MCU1646888.1 hypothetical protein [Nocardia sp.]